MGQVDVPPAGDRLPGLTVFFPAHDEVENVGGAVREALDVLPDVALAGEVVVVDDGSSDGTADVVRAARAADPRVRLVRHPRNLGYGAALRSGIAASRMPFVFWTDADRQFDLAELPAFLRHLERADAVIGYRVRRSDPPGRRFGGFAWSLLVRLLLGVRSRDVDCAYKVFPGEPLRALDLRAGGAMISAEILARARQDGLRILEVGVRHRPRLHGTPSGGDPRVVLRAFAELARLQGELRRGGASRLRGSRRG